MFLEETEGGNTIVFKSTTTNSFFILFSFLFLYSSWTKIVKQTNYFFAQDLQLGFFSMGLNQQASSLNTFSFSHAGIHLGTSEENFDFGFLYALPLKVVNQVTPPSVFDLYIAFEATLGEIIEVCLNVFKQIIINDL